VLRRRRSLAGLLLVVAVAVGALLITDGSPRTRASSVQSRPAPVVADTNRPPASEPVHQAAPATGSLPQTHDYPSGTGAHFSSLMASLWAGIVQDSADRALVAFFPKDAYLQLKAINSASSDWTDRLVRDYRLDIGAAHMLLGGDAAQARLIGVDVPATYGHWVEPGVCANSVGYYEVPNARMLYSVGGQIRSFGIASMISWRGVWYVVHLGAILRPSDSGTVDEPAVGHGTSAYSGTC
jgi:hypothetical protein